MGDKAFLEQEVAALEAERNRAGARIEWQFSCEQARSKLQRLYPKLQEPQEEEEPSASVS